MKGTLLTRGLQQFSSPPDRMRIAHQNPARTSSAVASLVLEMTRQANLSKGDKPKPAKTPTKPNRSSHPTILRGASQIETKNLLEQVRGSVAAPRCAGLHPSTRHLPNQLPDRPAPAARRRT